jgi:regulator of RNase E activity RraB
MTRIVGVTEALETVVKHVNYIRINLAPTRVEAIINVVTDRLMKYSQTGDIQYIHANRILKTIKTLLRKAVTDSDKTNFLCYCLELYFGNLNNDVIDDIQFIISRIKMLDTVYEGFSSYYSDDVEHQFIPFDSNVDLQDLENARQIMCITIYMLANFYGRHSLESHYMNLDASFWQILGYNSDNLREIFTDDPQNQPNVYIGILNGFIKDNPAFTKIYLRPNLARFLAVCVGETLHALRNSLYIHVPQNVLDSDYCLNAQLDLLDHFPLLYDSWITYSEEEKWVFMVKYCLKFKHKNFTAEDLNALLQAGLIECPRIIKTSGEIYPLEYDSQLQLQ